MNEIVVSHAFGGPIGAPSADRRGIVARRCRRRRLLKCALAAMSIAVGGIAVSADPASADIISDVVGGTSVGGSSGTGYYSPAQFYPQTICTGNTNQVKTVVVGSPRSGTGGQWFTTQVWAIDVTRSGGTWKPYGWTAATWVAETHSISYSMPDYKQLAVNNFTGIDGHSYQVFVEVLVAVNGVWQPLPSMTSNHFTTFGAILTNIYGVAVQGLPGAATSYCTVV